MSGGGGLSFLLFVMLFVMLFAVYGLDVLVLIFFNIFGIKPNDDCQCAKNSYVSKVWVSLIIISVLGPLIFCLSLALDSKDIPDGIEKTIYRVLLIIMLISLSIIFPYSSAMMFKLSKQVEKDKCDCFDSTFKNMLKYYSILRLTPFIIILMIMLYLFLEMILFLFPLK